MPGSDTSSSSSSSSNSASFSTFAPLRQRLRNTALTVPPSASVRATLLKLDSAHADAIVVVDEASGIALGIVTLHDVLRRIAIEAGDLEAPIATIMTGGLITLPADATAHQASVVMVRRGVGHLVLTQPDGRYFDVVAQGDLYAQPGAQTAELVSGILAARDIAPLAALAGGVRRLATQLLAERVGAEAICQRISALNDLLTLQVIELTAGRFELPYVPWCWLLFGSEGRLEQTLATDQDNGLIFAATGNDEAARLRQAFLPFARAVNEALDACGFPLCKGNIMASNPAWCLSLAEWKSAFGGWMATGRPQALLNSTIFFDFRPLYGHDSLAGELREWLLAQAPAHPMFLRALVENTVNWASPLNWWQGFRYERNQAFPHTIDLKLHGARPFVDAARIYALAKGVPDTNTVERLRTASGATGLSPRETAALVDAFYHIQRLRLEHQVDVAAEATAAPNRVNPDRLHELNRHILKESLKQAHSLQQRLARDYALG